MYEVIENLLARGVRTDVVDSDEIGILHVAGYTGNLTTIRILLRHEEPLSVTYTHPDIYGNTPMRDFEVRRKFYVQEDEKLHNRSKEAFEELLKKVNSRRLEQS